MTREQEINNQIESLRRELKDLYMANNADKKQEIVDVLSGLGFREFNTDTYRLRKRGIEFSCSLIHLDFRIVNLDNGDIIKEYHCYDYDTLLETIHDCPEVTVYERTFSETVYTVDPKDLSEDRDNDYEVTLLRTVSMQEGK